MKRSVSNEVWKNEGNVVVFDWQVQEAMVFIVIFFMRTKKNG